MDYKGRPLAIFCSKRCNGRSPFSTAGQNGRSTSDGPTYQLFIDRLHHYYRNTISIVNIITIIQATHGYTAQVWISKASSKWTEFCTKEEASYGCYICSGVAKPVQTWSPVVILAVVQHCSNHDYDYDSEHDMPWLLLPCSIIMSKITIFYEAPQRRHTLFVESWSIC